MDDRTSRAGDAARSASTSGQPTRSTPSTTANPNAPKVVQPKPQALPSRSGPSSILVSPRQKGNPILNSVKSTAWEYSDIPADYVLGATTCALFLSLKYHRLHPEYIYNRIRDLKGQYDLRIVLTMVDVENHEDSLRELSKTSLVNNVTIMLCWSAQEAGRYLELFKTFEHAAPTSIRAKQSSTYSENMVEFITVPRGVNKTDAVGLVSNFGSIRTAINAGPEEIGLIAGWGDKKVQRWCNAVKEPFRVKKAAKRSLGPTRENTQAGLSRDTSMAEGESQTPREPDVQAMARQRLDDAVPVALGTQQASAASGVTNDADRRPDHRPAEDLNEFEDDEEALKELDHAPQPAASRPAKRKKAEEDVSEGVMAALKYVGRDITDPGTEFALSMFDLDENEMEAAKFVFQGLEKLVLNIALRVSNQDTFGEVTDKFATLLRSTTQLQHFYFQPTHWKSDVGPQPLFERLGLGTTWPKLQTLSLKGVFATENDLISVVKRHKQALTTFVFSKCSLSEGTWAEVVDEVVYGTPIRRFVLDRVNEKGLSHLNYASLSTSERDLWKYEGHLKVTKDGERSFVETNPAKKSVYASAEEVGQLEDELEYQSGQFEEAREEFEDQRRELEVTRHELEATRQ
ncbi:ssDNA endonuclease and repair protein rad10 [Didymella keratinophila]|nr:ssDNA endonuclease and repair protein rad10 [Didymella keratinophila]